MIPPSWRELALSPPRANVGPGASAILRSSPEDFVVDEILGFPPAGEGSHWLLRVRKRDANTEWVARQLASHLRCRAHEVGYAGLKDRRAVTTQWFTVPRSRSAPEAPVGLAGEGYEVLEAHAHTRKLPRGALAGNAFTLALRGFEGDRDAVIARLEDIRRFGVPDYFGPQRFGRELGNLGRVARGDYRSERSYTLSAARSLVFNAVLAQRVLDGSWSRLEAGDVANLDGTGSLFAVASVDAELQARVAALDVHPTGPLPGRPARAPVPTGHAGGIEARVLSEFAPVVAALEAEGVDAGRRALRAAVHDLVHRFEGDTLHLAFRLGAGSFATTVLREVLDARDP